MRRVEALTNFLSALGNLFRGLAGLLIAGLLGGLGYFGYQTYQDRFALDQQLQVKTAEIARLNDEVAAKELRIQQLDTAMRLLKVDHRLAELIMLSQSHDQNKKLFTKFQFAEVDDQGRALEREPKVFIVEGDTVYIDAWVVKYADDHVESADPLRSTSVCLFRRVFGEFQEPTEGFPLDTVGSRPAAYSRGSRLSDFERELWANFWDYANNPSKAQTSLGLLERQRVKTWLNRAYGEIERLAI